MIKSGDVVYFKEATRSGHRTAPKACFKGHGFGVFLGILPPFKPDVLPVHLMRMMGAIGHLSFDDVEEFLGNEAQAECVKKFEDKYYGKVVQTEEELKAKMEAIKAERQQECVTDPIVNDEEQTILIRPPLQLVDAGGRPVTSKVPLGFFVDGQEIPHHENP